MTWVAVVVHNDCLTGLGKYIMEKSPCDSCRSQQLNRRGMLVGKICLLNLRFVVYVPKEAVAPLWCLYSYCAR